MFILFEAFCVVNENPRNGKANKRIPPEIFELKPRNFVLHLSSTANGRNVGITAVSVAKDIQDEIVAQWTNIFFIGFIPKYSQQNNMVF